MTLKFNTQEDDNRQLTVTVEVGEPRVLSAMQKLARGYARDLRFPGFRPGKVPFGVVRGVVGEQALRQEAVEGMLPEIFNEVTEYLTAEEYALMDAARPTLDDIELTPMVLKFTLPLTPVVTLGDYRSLRKPIEPVEIADDAVEEAIEAQRASQATTEAVERGAEFGDTITISGSGYLGDDEEDSIFREDELTIDLREGVLFADVPFAEELVGMAAGDEKSFDITFPDEYETDESLNGKTAHFSVTLHKVETRVLPVLDDAFAAALPQKYESLAALREATATRLQRDAEQQQRNDLIEGMISDLLENVEELKYPRGAVEAQIDDQIDEMKRMIESVKWNWDDYLAQTGRSEDEIREDFEDAAVTTVERQIVFQQFLRQEQLLLGQAELEAAIEARLAEYEEDEMRKFMDRFLRENNAMRLREQLMADRVNERIVAIYQGTAPELDATDVDADAAADEAVEADDMLSADMLSDDVQSEDAESGDEPSGDEPSGDESSDDEQLDQS